MQMKKLRMISLMAQSLLQVEKVKVVVVVERRERRERKTKIIDQTT